MPRILPNLRFGTEAEEAVAVYTSILDDSRILQVSLDREWGAREAGMVLAVELDLGGQRLVAINGGSELRFDEAPSLEVRCESRAAIGAYRSRPVPTVARWGSAGGWGTLRRVSWQITHPGLEELMTDADRERCDRVMAALLQMRTIDNAALERVAAG